MATDAPSMAAPTCAPSNPADPIVEAYIQAVKHAGEIDDNAEPDADDRLAISAARGAEEYALSWGVQSPDHAPLVAYLGAKLVEDVIGGMSMFSGANRVLHLGYDELHELGRIQTAFITLWEFISNGKMPELGQFIGEVRARPVNLLYAPGVDS